MTEAPRVVAAEMLGRVLRAGAYSNVLLSAVPNTPDGKLVRRLVYGTLRYLIRIDRLLSTVSSRPLDAIAPAILDVLRIATWELKFGDGAHHAAVNEAVDPVVRSHGQSVGGFLNAVLRAVANAEEALPPGPEGEALRWGVEPWIYARMVDAWGAPEAGEFFAASLEPAPRSGRARSTAAGGSPVAGIDGAVLDAPFSDAVVPQDPASVAVGLATAVEPGMTVLDLAAAPGGKTLHLFDLLAGHGLLVAADRHARRVGSARKRMDRLGITIPWVVADGREPPFRRASFDRVLVDAPCTGLGTVRRRPEIRHRLEPAGPARMGEIQRALVRAALELVARDGVVVYSACTVFPEETVEVVANLDATAPEGLPGRPEGAGWLLGPHLTGTDAMFISLIRPAG